MAENPEFSTTRALATSQTFGSNSTSLPECIARNASAFFFCPSVGIHRNWMRSADGVLHLFNEASHADDGASYRSTANFLGVIASRDAQGIEAPVERFEDSFSFDGGANAAGSAMFDVDRRAHADLVAFAIWLQRLEGREFHKADHVRRRVHRRQFGMVCGQCVLEFDGLLGFPAGPDRDFLHAAALSK